MPVLKADTPRQQALLKTFAGKLSAHLNAEAPAIVSEVDYGMLSVPLVGLAVDILKQRGLTKEEIEAMVMTIVDRQFQVVQSPILKIVR